MAKIADFWTDIFQPPPLKNVFVLTVFFSICKKVFDRMPLLLLNLFDNQCVFYASLRLCTFYGLSDTEKYIQFVMYS